MDSSRIDYFLEVVVEGSIILVSGLIALGGLIYHHFQKRHYMELLSEAEGEDRLNTAEREQQGVMIGKGLVEVDNIQRVEEESK